MSKVKDGCPGCKAEVFILGGCEENGTRQIVCPVCFLPFIVVISRKTGLPEGERFEIDPKEII